MDTEAMETAHPAPRLGPAEFRAVARGVVFGGMAYTGRREMFDQREQTIRYKWDAATGTGYQLRVERPWSGNRYRVEDWTNHVMTDEWECLSLEEALRVLDGLFELDLTQERHRLAAWAPESVQ
ncbi:hypothetical protein [Thiococcus pfennigii]|uniref:hypothetical protein n=1 Tax=Thiococcus pfennigii TaxID=1057 RepID=UPI001F5BE2FB|nr:hypothetical protein [Thiococcus pfennigii]